MFYSEKLQVFIFFVCVTVLCLASCDRDKATTEPEVESTLLHEPTDKVTVTVGNKAFTVDFRINEWCHGSMEYQFPPVERLKNRDELVDLFKSVSSHYMLNPGIETAVIERNAYAIQIEYILAQECFSDGCDSETRFDILQVLVTNLNTNLRDFPPFCARKSGVFLMAVILLKERNISEKYIDDETLQQALLCLNTDIDGVSKEFLDFIIECCKMFLDDVKTYEEEEDESTLLREPTGEVTVTVGDVDFSVDFRFDAFCMEAQLNYTPSNRQSAIKSREELVDFYISMAPYGYYPSSVNLFLLRESYCIYIEYLLAQECFSDDFDSETRRNILPFIIAHQKTKYMFWDVTPVHAPCAQKCGVFIMAVILLKERNESAKYIDDDTLQQALSILNTDTWGVDEEFSNFIIECAEKLLGIRY